MGKEAARTGRGVREIVLEKGLLSEEELDRALSKQNLMHPEFRDKLYLDDAEA